MMDEVRNILNLARSQRQEAVAMVLVAIMEEHLVLASPLCDSVARGGITRLVPSLQHFAG